MSNKYYITNSDNKKLKKYLKKWEDLDRENRLTIKREANKINIMSKKDYQYFKVLLSSLKIKGIHARSMIDVDIIKALYNYYNFNQHHSNKFYDLIFIEVIDDNIVISKTKSGIYMISELFHQYSLNRQHSNLTKKVLDNVHENAVPLAKIDIFNTNLLDIEDIYCDEMDYRNLENGEVIISRGEMSKKFDEWRDFESIIDIFNSEADYKHFFTDFLYEYYGIDAHSIVFYDGTKYYTTTEVIQGYNDSNYIFNHRLSIKTIRDENGVLYKHFLGIRMREFLLESISFTT